MTYAEIVYAVLDLSKASTSDDSFLTEDHARFLLNKHRSQLLYEKYKNIKIQIPASNYQTICLDLEVTNVFGDIACSTGEYLASVQEIPSLMTIGTHNVYPMDYYNTNITLVSRDRMKYVGYNKYMKNIIYCSIGADNKLYFKSNNPQHKYLKKVKFTGIFEDTELANSLSCSSCSSDKMCDPFEQQFPLEEELVPALIQIVVQELNGSKFLPVDSINNAKDDLSNIRTGNAEPEPRKQ